MNLKLEIKEGHVYNNLLNEIDTDYEKFFKNGELNFHNKNYEKSFQYYHKCILLDPDNEKNIQIIQKLNKNINLYLKKIIDCVYHSYNNHNFNVSKYYTLKSLSIYKYFERYINNNMMKYIKDLNHKLSQLNTISNDNINSTELYNIKL
tara:strand:+ start:874 stop:1320 length:447 start_codon:yes stop_codon:yes gene_type:complete